MITPEQIREYRKRHKLSIEDMASKLGVSYATIYRWEKGHKRRYKLLEKALERLIYKKSKKI